MKRITRDSMTPEPARGKHRPQSLAILILSGLAVMLIATACTKENSPVPVAAPTERSATTLDGVLTVVLPTGLWLHQHQDSLQATHPNGRFRYYFGHQAATSVIRRSGYTKDVLSKREWRVSGERHYKKATHLTLERGGVRGDPKEVRHIWHLNAAGRLLVCDGIADAAYQDELGDKFKNLCSSSRMITFVPPKPKKKDEKKTEAKTKKKTPSKATKTAPSKPLGVTNKPASPAPTKKTPDTVPESRPPAETGPATR